MMGLDSIINSSGKNLKRLLEYIKNLERSKKIQLSIIFVIILAVSIFSVFMLNRKNYTILYTNLSAADAGAIMEKLTEMRIEAKPHGSDTIMVPSNLVDLTRMELAAQGLPKSSNNLDILQRGSGFGVTEEDKAIYRRYQLQEDLQNAIKTFSSIDDAKVSLFIPKESVFVIENQSLQATASILIHIKPGLTLSAGNVRAISELVQKSVPNLKIENVSVIDSDMNLLTLDEDTNEMVISDQLTLQEQVSDRLTRQVMNLLQPVFGIGNIMASVNAVLDFDENTIDSIRFEPLEGTKSGIISNIDTIRELSKNTGNQNGGEAGTGNNSSGLPTYPVMDTDDIVYEKNSEKIIYEINTIKEHLIKAKGSIKKLSVSVVLDSNTTSEQDFNESVTSIVANAIGVDKEYITVENLPFNGQTNLGDIWKDYNDIAKRAKQMENIRFFAVIFAAFLLSLIIFITIIKRNGSKSKEDEISKIFPSLDRSKIPGKDENSVSHEDYIESLNETLVNREFSVNGPKKDMQRTVAEKNIEIDPELAATIIRSWLAEEED